MAFAGMIQMEVIRPVWKQVVKGKSGNSQFLHRNVALFDKEGNITDYSMLALSTGELPLPGNIAVTNSASGNGSLLITWDDNPGVDMAKKSDRLKVVAIKDGLPLVVKGLEAVRSDGMSALQLPYEAGDEVHLYLYFMDEAGLVASPSFHAAVTIPTKKEASIIELSREEPTPQRTYQTYQTYQTHQTQEVVFDPAYSLSWEVYSDDDWNKEEQLPDCRQASFPNDSNRGQASFTPLRFGQDDNHIGLFGRGERVNSSLTVSPMTANLFLDSSLRVGMTTTYDYGRGKMVNRTLTSSPMTANLFLDSSLRVGMTTTYDYGRGKMVNRTLTSSPMTANLFLDSSLRVGMTTTYDYRGG
jgi:hypothetical protein